MRKRSMVVEVAKKNGRCHHDEDLSLILCAAQDKFYSLRDFGKKNFWPDVNRIFYDEAVKQGLKKIIRWHDLLVTEQSAYQRVHGLTYVMHELLGRSNGVVRDYNKELLLKAAILQDVADGLDLEHLSKSSSPEILAYNTFCYLIEQNAPENDWEELEMIYLLQFCLDDIMVFPVRAQNLMRKLRQSYSQEARWFSFVVYYESLLYIEDQYVRRGIGVRRAMVEVAAEYVPKINQLAVDLPAITRIWNPKVCDYFSEFE